MPSRDLHHPQGRIGGLSTVIEVGGIGRAEEHRLPAHGCAGLDGGGVERVRPPGLPLRSHRYSTRGDAPAGRAGPDAHPARRSSAASPQQPPEARSRDVPAGAQPVCRRRGGCTGARCCGRRSSRWDGWRLMRWSAHGTVDLVIGRAGAGHVSAGCVDRRLMDRRLVAVAGEDPGPEEQEAQHGRAARWPSAAHDDLDHPARLRIERVKLCAGRRASS